MSELWDLVWGKPSIDPRQLADAIEHEAAREGLDFRTRLLIRDGAQALEEYWGCERHREWLQSSGVGGRLSAMRVEAPVGFPFIKESLVEKTDPETIGQLLRDLGSKIH